MDVWHVSLISGILGAWAVTAFLSRRDSKEIQRLKFKIDVLMSIPGVKGQYEAGEHIRHIFKGKSIQIVHCEPIGIVHGVEDKKDIAQAQDLLNP